MKPVKSSIYALSFLSLMMSCSQFNNDVSKVIVDEPGLAQYESDGDCSHGSEKHLDSSRVPTSEDACSDVTRKEISEIHEMIELLGGVVRDPSGYDHTERGLQEFMNDSGVIQRFSASEMVRPNNSSAAKSCGHTSLLPAQCRWESGAVQALLAGKLRGVINNGNKNGTKGITLRNWWRPSCYNKAVGGAGASDHIQARGFDLDFATPEDRATAQRWLCQAYKDRPFNLQVGIGCQTLHIGVGSPKRLSAYPADGSRYWTYGSLKNCRVKRLEGDDCWTASRSTGKRFIWTDENRGVGGAL